MKVKKIQQARERVHFPKSSEGWDSWEMDESRSFIPVTLGTTKTAWWQWLFSVPKTTGLALPVSAVQCLPLWLQEIDLALLDSILRLQLETRGLLQSKIRAPYSFQVIAQEADRTLVLVVMEYIHPDEQAWPFAHHYADLAVRYLPAPSNSVVLWQEHGGWVAGFSRGFQWIYFQALSGGEIDDDTVRDLFCVWLSLKMQEVGTSLESLTLWTQASPESMKLLINTFGLPLLQKSLPKPVAPPTRWDLAPSRTLEVRKADRRSYWQRQGLLAGAAVALCFFAFSLLGLSWNLVSMLRCQAWLSQHQQDLQQIEKVQQIWEDFDFILQPTHYPLETLLAISQALPPKDVCLNHYEQGTDRIDIRAEARNSALAFQFLQNLKTSPGLSSHKWEMLPLHLLPNDLAQIQIQGTRATAQ